MHAILMLARLRRSGLTEFGNTQADFLNSLMPLAAFALVMTALRIAHGDAQAGLGDMLMTAIAVLAPVVLMHAFAHRWGLEANWLRAATVFTWSHWVILAALAVSIMVLGSLLNAAGVSLKVAVLLAELAWAAYGLAMHWIIVRYGLGVSRWRSVLALGTIELGTSVLIAVPLLLSDLLASGA